MPQDPARPASHQEQIDELARRLSLVEEMVAELTNDGILTPRHVAELEEALKSSRTIGAAVGLIMASRNVSEDEAIEILKRASQNSNRKMRELAAELVSGEGSSQDGERSGDPPA